MNFCKAPPQTLHTSVAQDAKRAVRLVFDMFHNKVFNPPECPLNVFLLRSAKGDFSSVSLNVLFQRKQRNLYFSFDKNTNAAAFLHTLLEFGGITTTGHFFFCRRTVALNLLV